MSILVVILITVVFALGVLVGLQFSSVSGLNLSYQATTVSNPCNSMDQYKNTQGGGGFPAVPGTSPQDGELLDRSQYWISWASDGTSQSIVMEGSFKSCNLPLTFADTVSAIRYAFYINTGNGFVSMETKDFPQGFLQINFPSSISPPTDTWQTFPAQVVHIDGIQYQDASGVLQPIIDGSILRVQLQFGKCTGGNPCQAWNWYGPMAQDEARLQSAIPDVSWEKDLYGVGETAKVHWTVPVTQVNGTAYYLSIVNMNSGATVSPYNEYPLTSTTGIASVAVTPDMFVVGGINRLRATIDSQVFHAQMQDTATIDNPNLAPTVKSVTWDKPSYREGDTVTVTITATPNPTTKAIIVSYYVLAHIAGLKEFDAFSNSSSVSFTATTSGVLTVEASAIDSAGRSSGVYRASETVGTVVGMCQQYPDLVECKGGGGNGAISLLVAVLEVIAVTIGSVLLGYFLPENFKWIALIALIAGFLALWVVGSLAVIAHVLGV